MAESHGTNPRVVRLAKQVDKDVAGAADGERVKAMSAAIKALAKATK